MAMHLNSFTYAFSVPATSTTLNLRNDLAQQRSVIISNRGTTPVFVFSDTQSRTITFPVDGGGPVQGTVILAGSVQTYDLSGDEYFLMAISESGTNTIFVKLGSDI